MKIKFTEYESEFATLGRKMLRETKGDYIVVDLFQYISYWVLKNQEEGINFHDGRYWTYFTVKELASTPDFQHLSEWQVRRGLGALIELKAIEKGNYNKNAYDHTSWYTVKREFIEAYQPNLIRLFEKKRGQKPTAENLKSNCGKTQIEIGESSNRNEHLHESNCATPQNNIDNHTNNHSTNQEKKDIIFLNSQHQQVDMVVSEVKGDSKGDAKSEHPLTPEQWKKYSKKMPQGKFDDTLAQDLKDWIDKYGEEKVDEYVDYIARFWSEITYLPKFVEKVGEQLDLDASDARRNGKPFGKIKNEYRMRW